MFAILRNRADEILPRMNDMIVGLYEDWLWLDERIETVMGEIVANIVTGVLIAAVRAANQRTRRPMRSDGDP